MHIKTHARRLTLALVGLLAVAALAAPDLVASGIDSLGPLFLVLPLVGETVSLQDASMDNAMKVFFEDSVFNNVVTDTELLDLFEQDTDIMEEETTGGRYIESAQYFGLPSGVGARRSDGYIPVPGGPTIENSRIYLKKVLGATEMEGDVMRRVRSNEGAFLNWAERALPDLVTHLTNELDVMLLSYGAAIRARVNQAVPADPVPIDSAHGLAGLTNPHLLFLEGQRIVFGPNPDGTGLRQGGTGDTLSAEITEVDPATPALDVDTLPSDVADNDYIFPGDDADNSTQEGGADKEPMGLLGLVDDGSVLATFQNIVRANFRLWRSITVDGSVAPYNGNLTEDLLEDADDECFVDGGGKPDTIVTTRAGRKSYWRDLRTQRRFNDPRGFTGGPGDTPTIDLGDRELELRVSRKLSPELTFMLQTDTFKRFTLGRFEWDDTSGSIWHVVTDAKGRKDAFWAFGYLYLQMACFHPRKNVKIENLSP